MKSTNLIWRASKYALSLMVAVGSWLTATPVQAQDTDAATQKAAAEKIINDFTGGKLSVTVTVDLTPTDGKDKFSYEYAGGQLQIHASNGVSACRGFYDFVKNNGAGICSWTANRFQMPEQVTKTKQTVYTSPYRHHQYFNVVTYGYSTPYWDEERWDKEIAWMAMHGIDMPLMLIGSEAIYREVFKEMYKVTDAQLDDWEVGPAHLPWMRMGNLAGKSFDGPLGQNWHNRQRELAHHVLGKMRELGMKPIVPAFGGFVPKAVADKIQQQGGHYTATGWDWIPQSYRNYRLTPLSDGVFKAIGKKFIELWDAEYEKSYGEFKYYLSDSFNEMTVPNDVATLKGYGEQIYTAIKEGSNNDDAVWVTQGWEFIYGSGKWTNGSTSDAKFKALTQSVPNDKFMVLSMSPEYGGYGNKKWESYDNYAGKDWINTMLPNMGGKNFWTGKLQSYAQDFPNTLWNSNGSKNCRGWGMTMEGIEYNEMLYELIADMGWEANHTKNLNDWVNQYGKARYGNYTKALQDLHSTLRNTVYTSYIDHQNFGWQGNGKSSGYYQSGNIGTTNDQFFQGFETFFGEENIAALKAGGELSAPLRADLMEFAAFYAAARVEKICQRIISAKNMNDKEGANNFLKKLEQVMLDMDYVLTGHPLYDEAKWEAKAVAMAKGDKTTEEKYRKNARRIVSIWYGSHGGHEAVNDYASRIYAGLIRDYYLPRLYAELDGMVNGKSYNLRDIEKKFCPNGDVSTNAPALSPICRVIDGERVNQTKTADQLTDTELLDLCAQVVETARDAGNVQVEKNVLKLSNEKESTWYAIHSNNPAALDLVFTSTGEQASVSAGFAVENLTAKTSQYWRVVDNGDGTVHFENRNGQQLAYDGGFKTYRYSINTDAQTDFDQAECRYAIKLAKASNWMHYNNTLQLYGYKDNNGFFAGSTWTLQDVSAAVNEVSTQADYDRYRSRLEGFARWANTSLYGQSGQPRSEEALNAAIAKLGTRDLALETYTEFLHNKWYGQVAEAFTVPTGVQAKKLFYLLLEGMDLPEVADEAAVGTYRTAIQAAQQTLAGADEAACQSAITTLQNAIKAYMANVPNFPYVSPAPANGEFHYASKAFTMKVGNGGYVTTNAMSGEAFTLTNSTKPTSAAGYWVACGDDKTGYTFYNVGVGASKVLGISGSEDGARAKLYAVGSVPSGVTTKFLYRLNELGGYVFYYNGNNTWNKRGNYLALWKSDNAFGKDQGSSFTLTTVTYDFGPAPGPVPEGTQYAIQLNGQDLYFSTHEVADNDKTTYSLSATPEYFVVTPVAGVTNGFTITSTNGKKVGHSVTNSWDFSNDASTWIVENIEGQPTTILKQGASVGFGADNEADGQGVFTDKADRLWVFHLHQTEGISSLLNTGVHSLSYDLMGRRTGKSYRGIVLRGGQKELR